MATLKFLFLCAYTWLERNGRDGTNTFHLMKTKHASRKGESRSNDQGKERSRKTCGRLEDCHSQTCEDRQTMSLEIKRENELPAVLSIIVHRFVVSVECRDSDLVKCINIRVCFP